MALIDLQAVSAPIGGVTEWLKVPVLKTGVLFTGTRGSNPLPSAFTIARLAPAIWMFRAGTAGMEP